MKAAVAQPPTQVASAPGKATPVFHVPIADVRPNPRNPRSELGDLSDLVESIGEYGVLQPCLGRRTGSTVTLICGNRRLAASKKANRQTLPVILVGDRLAGDALMVAVVENLHRAAMSPTDEARACRDLIEGGLKRSEVAAYLGRSPAWVSDRLALLALDDKTQRQIDNGAISLQEGLGIARLVRNRRNGSVVCGARAPRTFVRSHPLASFAAASCDRAGHPKAGRVGPACGQCWEQAIRLDEREGVPRYVPPVDVDEVKIERAIDGEQIDLTTEERLEAIDRLTARGKSAKEIEAILHMSASNVSQLRSRYLGSVEQSAKRGRRSA